MNDTLYTFHNIINICEVTPAITIIENLDIFSFYQLVGKTKISHIRSTSRSINSKETKSGTRNIIELAIGMRHQFVTLLGSGIKTDRIIHFVIGTIRDFGITAIDRTGRSVHQMLYSILPIIITVAACFKNIVKTDKITFDVCIRIDNTITYTCLSSKG